MLSMDTLILEVHSEVWLVLVKVGPLISQKIRKITGKRKDLF